MVKDEHGPAVPELTRRITLTSCARDPAAGLASVLTSMPAAGVALGDVLADSGYSHRVPATWASPLRQAGAQLVLDLHPSDRGPRGTHDGAIIANGCLYCPCTPPALLQLIPLPPGAGPGGRRQAVSLPAERRDDHVGAEHHHDAAQGCRGEPLGAVHAQVVRQRLGLEREQQSEDQREQQRVEDLDVDGQPDQVHARQYQRRPGDVGERVAGEELGAVPAGRLVQAVPPAADLGRAELLDQRGRSWARALCRLSPCF